MLSIQGAIERNVRGMDTGDRKLQESVFWDDAARWLPFRSIVLVNELGKKARLQYNNRGFVVRREFPEGNSVEFSYDSRGNTLEGRQRPKPGSVLADGLNRLQFTYRASLCRARPRCLISSASSVPASPLSIQLECHLATG